MQRIKLISAKAFLAFSFLMIIYVLVTTDARSSSEPTCAWGVHDC